MVRCRRRSCQIWCAFAATLVLLVVLLKSSQPTLPDPLTREMFPQLPQSEKVPVEPLLSDKELRDLGLEGEDKAKTQKELETFLQTYPLPNSHVHGFYYIWYGNPKFDAKYLHWNHPMLPHWDPKVGADFPTDRHSPPDDIGANFYPALGAYSSRDPDVITAHMRQMRMAAIGVVAVSWYPPGMADDNGEPLDDIVPLVLDAAHKYELQVTFHIEPFKGRDHKTMLDSIKYIVEKYGEHPAFFRFKSKGGKMLPLFYIYDSYLMSPDEWAVLLKSNAKMSVRDTPYDAMFVGLLVEEKHKHTILSAGFDGVYTYFATNGFTYGSSYRNWRSIKAFCDANDLLFIPSVGPGYIDTNVRPWNSQNTRNRLKGRYYETALNAAVDSGAAVVSITSFNEWHEGTQIEMAVPKAGRSTYLDYLPFKPAHFLHLTRKWAEKFPAA